MPLNVSVMLSDSVSPRTLQLIPEIWLNYASWCHSKIIYMFTGMNYDTINLFDVPIGYVCIEKTLLSC